jgi:hypothetical protein
MRSYAQLIGLLAVLLTEPALASIPDDPAQVHPLSVGNPAPVSSARTADGVLRKFSPDGYSKPTIVLFYRGGWCPVLQYATQRHASRRAQIACQWV